MLNPQFVAWLMGFPLDWLHVETNSKLSATPSSPRAPKLPATSSNSYLKPTASFRLDDIQQERLYTWILKLRATP